MMPYIANIDGRQTNALALERSDFDRLKGKEIICPGCSERMFTKHSKAPLRTPYFAHYRTTTHCPTSNMSPEHLAMQALIDKAITQCNGWQSVIEYSDTGWRGDVVAIHTELKKMLSFEVQISSMSYDKAMDRIDKHKASGIESVIWLLGKEFYWQTQVSGCRFTAEKSWDPTKGISVTYRGLQDPYEEYSEEKTNRTIEISIFIKMILNGELVPTYPDGIAITRDGELTTYFDDDSVYENIWIFQSRTQIKAKTNEIAYARALEEYSIRSQEYWEKYYAEKAIEREAKKKEREEGIERWKQKKRDLRTKLAEIIPDIYFDETAYNSTAKGDVALFPNGQYIVIQPVRKHINEYGSRGLVRDARIPILFMYEYEKNKLLYKFPYRQSVYCLADIIGDKSTLNDMMTAQIRHPKPLSSPFLLC